MDAPTFEPFPPQSFEAWHGIEEDRVVPAIKWPIKHIVDVVPITIES